MERVNELVRSFQDCRLVKGFNRSSIYDFSRKRYSYITSKQASWYEEIDGWSVARLKEKCERNKDFNEFVNWLFSQEYIFTCSEEEYRRFPPVPEKWYHPSQISNMLLYRSSKSNFNINNLIKDFEKVGLQYVQIILEDSQDLTSVLTLIKSLSLISTKSIEVIAKEDVSDFFIEHAIDLANTQITNVTITNSSAFKICRRSDSIPFNIIYITNDFTETLTPSSPDPLYFTVDIRLYMESRFYNNFYNKKLVVDSGDNILNRVGGEVIGKLQKGELEKVMASKSFIKYWKIGKDSIEVCKDCEHRYMCVDSRVPVYSKGRWVFMSECRYNPYSSEWA